MSELKSESRTGRGSLVAGGVAAVLASACCLGPLVLIALGVSGAWIGNLAALEPYRPWFIGAALVAMVFAWRRIYRPAQDCDPGEVCAVPQVRTAYKITFWIVALLASSTPSSCALKSFHSAELIERHASAMGSCALPCDSRVGDRVTS